MALLLVALRKARPWGWGWGYQPLLMKGKLGILGAIGGSGMSSVILGGNVMSNSGHLPSLHQSCRHYYLPPPPPHREIVKCVFVGVFRITEGYSVLSSAEFAVKTHNETKGENIRFVRVVRASGMSVAGMMYYITLEAVDEKGDLNVYYAEVLDRPFENFRELINWQLVDDSFSYSFEEIRSGEWLNRKSQRDLEVAKNNSMRDWLNEMALQSIYDTHMESFCGQPIGKPDPIKRILDFEEMLSTGTCLPCPPNSAIDHVPTVASDAIVPVFYIKAYEMVYEYALFAVSTHNENEDSKIHLEEVLWASKSNVDNGFYYFLLLEAMDGKKELKYYLAIIKVCQSKEELIKWHLIDDSFFNVLQKDQIKLGA